MAQRALISTSDTAYLLQSFFILEALSVLIFHALPFLNRYLYYGLRSSNENRENDVSKKSPQDPPRSAIASVLDLIDRTIRYPVLHSYFTHFYVVSLLSSLFWGFQILTRGTALRVVSQTGSATGSPSSMSKEQVVLVWFLMVFQGARRLYESITLTKSSTATMSVSHYIVGMLHYLAMGIAVWIEGSRAILGARSALDFFKPAFPSFSTMIVLPFFIIASGTQFDCHRYLASLPKYSLPEHPMFKDIVCPHYFAEFLIYISLSFLAAPRGQFFNKTIFSAAIFTGINLGITADSTKKWYIKKFGADKVGGRARMIANLW